MSDDAAQREQALLDRVVLRLASTKTDSQLEAQVAQLLVPVLEVLTPPGGKAAEAPATRTRVMAALGHLNKLVKPLDVVQLPVGQLIGLLERSCRSESAHPNVVLMRNFALMYLDMGFFRLGFSDQLKFVPELLRVGSLSGMDSSQSDSMLFLAVVGMCAPAFHRAAAVGMTQQGTLAAGQFTIVPGSTTDAERQFGWLRDVHLSASNQTDSSGAQAPELLEASDSDSDDPMATDRGDTDSDVSETSSNMLSLDTAGVGGKVANTAAAVVNDTDMARPIDVADVERARDVLAQFFFRVILFSPSTATSVVPTPRPVESPGASAHNAPAVQPLPTVAASAAAAASASADRASVKVSSPGLSCGFYSNFASKLDKAQQLQNSAVAKQLGRLPQNPVVLLNEVKLAVLEFVQRLSLEAPRTSDKSTVPTLRRVFAADDTVLLYTAASVDSHFRVSERGEDALKWRLPMGSRQESLTTPNLESIKLVSNAMNWFMGSTTIAKLTKSAAAHPDAPVVLPRNVDVLPIPASIRQRTAMLSHIFNRSVLSANIFPRTVSIIFESLYGSTDSNTSAADKRLRAAGMQFVVWVSRQATDEQLSKSSPLLLNGLLRYIDEQSPDASELEIVVRTFCFEAIALLAKRSPKLFSTNIDLLEKLFLHLRIACQNVRAEGLASAVQDSLLSLISAYRSNLSIFDRIKWVLKTELETEGETPTRVLFCVCVYANRIFDFSNPFGRYVCLVCLLRTSQSQGDAAKSEDAHTRSLIDVATTGLSPYRYTERLNDIQAYSDDDAEWVGFSTMMTFLQEAKTAPAELFTHAAALVFLDRVLQHSVDAEIRSSSLDFHDSSRNERLALYLREHLSDPDAEPTFKAASIFLQHLCIAVHARPSRMLLSIMLRLLAASYSVQRATGMEIASQMFKHWRNLVLATFGSLNKIFSAWIETSLDVSSRSSADAELDEGQMSGDIYAVTFALLSVSSDEGASEVLKSLMMPKLRLFLDTPGSPQARAQAGAVLAAGYVIEFGVAPPLVPSTSSVFRDAASILFQIVRNGASDDIADASGDSRAAKHSGVSMVVCALRAIAASSRYFVLFDDSQVFDQYVGLVQRGVRLIKDFDRTQHSGAVCEAVSEALGNMALGLWRENKIRDKESDFSQQCVSFGRQVSIALIDELAVSKHFPTHIAVGRAITCACVGEFSSSAINKTTFLDRLLPAFTQSTRSLLQVQADLLRSVIERVISKNLSKGNQRLAAATWLYQILDRTHKSSDQVEPAQVLLFDEALLIKFQSIFTYLLSESDETLQDVAANAIVLLHEMAEQYDARMAAAHESTLSLKQALIDTLVLTLTGKSVGMTKNKLTELASATQESVMNIFEEAEVSTKAASSGTSASKSSAAASESVTTYKELCSLATEMGKPEMVYQFMSIVSHGRQLRGTHGATLATAKLLKSHGESMAFDGTTLKFLVPRLYRSLFDPSPAVCTSMKQVLQEIASAAMDTKAGGKPSYTKLVVSQLDAVMDLLLDPTETTGRIWRTREASAGALADALGLCEAEHAHSADKVIGWLPTTLKLLLRLLDDIKETVRIAAKSAVASVSALILRLADPTTDRIRRAKVSLDSLTDGESSLTDSFEVKYARADARLGAIIPLLADLLGPTTDMSADARRAVVNMFVELIQQNTRNVGTIGGEGATSSPATLLVPHAPTLIAALLPLLTELEPQAFSYLQQQASSQSAAQNSQASQANMLESVRVSISASTPVSDTLRILCSECVTRQNAVEVSRALGEAIKSGVGLPTRAAAGRCVAVMCESFNSQKRLQSGSKRIFGRHTKGLLLTLANAIARESSLVVQKQFATSLAAVCRIAHHKEAIAGVVQTLISWYFQTSTQDAAAQAQKTKMRFCSAVALSELAHKAPSATFGRATGDGPSFANVACTVFFGSLDADKPVRVTMGKSWEEVFAARGGIHNVEVLRAVVSKVLSILEGSSEWSAKIHSANVAQELASKVPILLGQVSETDSSSSLLSMLVHGFYAQLTDRRLQRMWKGKHTLVRAFTSLVVCSSDAMAELTTSHNSPDDHILGGVGLTDIFFLFATELSRQTGSFDGSGVAGMDVVNLRKITDEETLLFKRYVLMACEDLADALAKHIAGMPDAVQLVCGESAFARLLNALIPLLPSVEQLRIEDAQEVAAAKPLILQVLQHGVRATGLLASLWSSIAFTEQTDQPSDGSVPGTEVGRGDSVKPLWYICRLVSDPTVLREQLAWNLRQVLLEALDLLLRAGSIPLSRLAAGTGNIYPRSFASADDHGNDFTIVEKLLLEAASSVEYGLVEAKFTEVRIAGVNACQGLAEYISANIAEARALALFKERDLGARLTAALTMAMSADPSLSSAVLRARSALGQLTGHAIANPPASSVIDESPLKRHRSENSK